MLVKQGNVFVTTKLEEFGSDVAGGRAPRTAVGLTQDGRILLVVVDGRQALSKGMSLLELALFLRELGAVNAMNLDGGGSSEMIVKGRIVNKPSDGKERRVGNALAVVPRKLAI
jgi:exopolysaccharide biosynthesis protein